MSWAPSKRRPTYNMIGFGFRDIKGIQDNNHHTKPELWPQIEATIAKIDDKF